MTKYSIKFAFSEVALFDSLWKNIKNEDEFKKEANKLIPDLYYATVKLPKRTWIIFSKGYKTLKDLEEYVNYPITGSKSGKGISDALIDWLGDEIQQRSHFVGEIQ